MITSLDALVQGIANGPKLAFLKNSQTTEGAGTFHSLWKATGSPAAGASPPAFGAGSGYTPTNTTLGSFNLASAVAPAKNYVGRVAAASSVIGTLVLYDRLWACSGFSTVSTSLQSVVTPGTLPALRDPNLGSDVEPWIEIYTAPGATGATWTLTGTDAAGNAGRTWTYTHPANAESIGQLVPMVMGTASTPGIRVAASFQANISSGTAGDAGFTLVRRLASIPVSYADVAGLYSAVESGLAELLPAACVSMLVYCSAATSGLFFGELGVAQA